MTSAHRIYCAVLFCSLASVANAHAQTTKILDNGKDTQKLVVAILADGYAAGDGNALVTDVNTLFVSGVLGHDFYRDHQSAFNVYRVALVSNESGVSTPGNAKDTALKTIFNGDWNQCWISEAPETDGLITAALSGVPKVDLVVILQNETGFGGCRRGDRLYVTKGAGWEVAAHEYGHGIGGLYDEYTNAGGAWSGGQLNRLNCSTELDRTRVAWKDLIVSTTPIPTSGSGPVGMYAGCSYASTGIYNPTNNCRMISNAPPFCPVCLRTMVAAVRPYEVSGPASPTNVRIIRPAAAARYSERAAVSNPMQTQTRTATPSTVRLRVRVTKTGEATVLDARELSGDVVLSQQARSPVVYELSRRGVAFFAQSLADDPFIAHSYAPPGQPPGHKNVDVESAEITITVPNMTLSRLAADAVGLSIYKVDEARLGATINVDSLSRLKRLQATRTLVSVPGATFQAALRTKLNIR